MKEFNFPFKRGIFGFLGVFVLAVIAFFASMIAVVLVGAALQHGYPALKTDIGSQLISLAGYCASFASAAWVMWLLRTDRSASFTEAVGYRKTSAKTVLISAFGGYFAIVLMTAVVYLLFPLPHPVSPAVEEGKTLSGIAFLMFAFGAVILAPIFEELVFRGFIQNMLRAVFRGNGERFLVVRDMAAIVIASAFFAAAHGTASGFPVLFAAGLAMGFTYYKTGSLFASMSVHFMNNFIVSLLVAASLGH